jgi:glycosyltransferase involved in cell wall biosynthesis
MNMTELVSIIISIFNMDTTILRAIKSCLVQTYKNIEIIVVDDCSIDNTKIVLEDLIKSKKINYFYLNKNHGRAYATNFGVRKAKGDFICFLDADDSFPKTSIQKRIKFLLNNKGYKIVCGSTVYLNNNDTLKFVRLVNNNILLNKNKHFVANQFLNVSSTPFITATLMYNKSIFDKIGYLDTNKKIIRSQDADFTYRVLKKYKIAFIKDSVYNYYKGSKPKIFRLKCLFSQIRGKIYTICKHKKGVEKYYLIFINLLQFPLKLIHQILFF